MIKTHQFASGSAAEAASFKQFNAGETLGVEIPNGHSTISARLPSGECVTFSFVPYEEGEAPQCVDIKYHGGEQFSKLRSNWHKQNVIIFAGGGTDHRTEDAKHPATLTTLLLK